MPRHKRKKNASVSPNYGASQTTIDRNRKSSLSSSNAAIGDNLTWSDAFEGCGMCLWFFGFIFACLISLARCQNDFLAEKAKSTPRAILPTSSEKLLVALV